MKIRKSGLMTYQIPTSLKELELLIRRDFAVQNQPAKSWSKKQTTKTGEKILDVAIIGGGASGLALSFSMRREGVTNQRVFDESDVGREGPWVTTARMQTLRSPKHLTGPHLGQPSLTFRSWFEAQWGADKWEKLGKIPKEMWMDYLIWYRRVTGVRVESNTQVEKILPGKEYATLSIHKDGVSSVVYARHVVLATGRAASGGVSLPQQADILSSEFYAHTEDLIDFDQLKGKRILVVGGAASAVDSAATALERGAGSVKMLIRAPEMPRLNKFKYIVYPGFLRGFYKLPDRLKWAFLKAGFDARIAAPRDSMLRLKYFANFKLWLGAGVEKISIDNQQVRIKTGRGEFVGDFVIFGTGYAMDLSRQLELSEFCDDILLWKDVFKPETGKEDATLSNYPYLGEGFQLKPKNDTGNTDLDRIHMFNAAATLSHAPVSSDIPGTNTGVERLTDHLVSALFCRDADAHLNDMQAFEEPELLGDEWDEA
jgi:FAD-dependent urate hydroxylase